MYYLAIHLKKLTINLPSRDSNWHLGEHRFWSTCSAVWETFSACRQKSMSTEANCWFRNQFVFPPRLYFHFLQSASDKTGTSTSPKNIVSTRENLAPTTIAKQKQETWSLGAEKFTQDKMCCTTSVTNLKMEIPCLDESKGDSSEYTFSLFIHKKQSAIQY